MKILILRFSSIGDIVLTTPVIRAVKTQLGAEVHYATKRKFETVLEENPYIDRIHFLDDSLSDLIGRLRKERFDYIVDLHNNLRTRIVKICLLVRSRSVNKLNLAKWLMVNFKINRLPDVHIVDRYLAAASGLGVKADALGLDYYIPERDEVPLDMLPAPHRSGYVAYAIGGLHNTKKLPVNKMVELCRRINYPIVMLGGKEDVDKAEEVIRQIDSRDGNGMGSTMLWNACGKFNLSQSASLLKSARCVFTHDTGLMHIASALRKEVFSIWGNTIPAFGMFPYRTQNTFLENKGLSCRPCSKIGFSKCPKGHFQCMNGIVFDFRLP